ncbi:transaldolase family protein [Herbiconiux sp.]|jgi:transaldolase|uniref:transaldolase family protein n=1 Tax=Herbiconiux sp. TaxID=1871186 RepID=UPI0025BAA9F6|nr:transaldolase family protein [Herbiconiux sp.]
MKLYADSADTAQVIPLLEDGLIRGVTTNPSILARDGLSRADLPRLYDEFSAAGAQEIFFQATGGSRAELRDDAEAIAAFGHRMVVKVPATPDGFRVARELVQHEVRVLLTAVYSLAQATFAASLGVDYIAPYFGRLVDSGEDGLAKVSNMTRVLAPTRTRVLVASVRSPNAAATLALNGVSHLTADVPVLLAMMIDPVTEQSAAEFERVAAG